jgi:thymidylate kinase
MYIINNILPKYDFLVTQRCWLDNFPYRLVQGISLKKSLFFLQPTNFTKPDIIFFLDCDYKTAYNRIKNQNGDKYEEMNFMKQLEKEFKNMFKQTKNNKFPIKLEQTRIITLDAKKSIKELQKEIKHHLSNLGVVSD